MPEEKEVQSTQRKEKTGSGELKKRPRAHINKMNPLPHARIRAVVQRDPSTMPISVLKVKIVPVAVQKLKRFAQIKASLHTGRMPVHITCRQPLTAWQLEALCFSRAWLLIAGPRCQPTRPIAAECLIGCRVDVLVAPNPLRGLRSVASHVEVPPSLPRCREQSSFLHSMRPLRAKRSTSGG